MRRRRAGLVALLLGLLAADAPQAQAPDGAHALGPQPAVGLSLTLPINRAPGAGLSRRAWAELGAVALTGAGHHVFSQLDASAVFIPLASLGWGGYVYHRTRTEPGYLRAAGFTGHHLGPAFRDATVVAGVSFGLMAGVGAAQGTLDMDADLLPLLVLYPAWGLVQQLLTQRYVAANLATAGPPLGAPYVVVPATAAAFGAVHVPNWELTGATTAMGAAFTPLYLRHRNLWPLGLYHGWLGAFFYRWVLDRNPWRELWE